MNFWNTMGMLIGIIDDPSSKQTTLSDDAYEYARMWRNVCDDLGAAHKEILELEKRIEDLEGPYEERFALLVKNLSAKIDQENETIAALESNIHGYERLVKSLQEEVTSTQLFSEKMRHMKDQADGRWSDLQVRNNVLMRELQTMREMQDSNTFVREVRTALEHAMGSHGTYTIGDCQGCIHAKKTLSTLKTITPQQADRFLNP